ncbi:MAG: riboflavin synthase [bacterium]
MFTGIVKTTGVISSIKPHGEGRRFKIDCGGEFNIETGASVAVDGVCLTAETSGDSLLAAVSSETLQRSTLSERRKGEPVNIEPALRVGDQLGGHFVSGHVDAVATIRRLQGRSDYYDLEISFPPQLNKFVAVKGSVALDGISLTVNRVDSGKLGVKIVPHTYQNTTLRQKRAGDRMNMEVDIFARYVHNLTVSPETDGLSRERLKAAGF